MNTRFLVVAILCGVCASLAAVVIWQKQQLDHAKAGATAGPVVLPPDISPLDASEKRHPAPTPVSEPIRGTPAPAASAEPADPPPPKAAEKPAAQQFMAALAKMVQDPKMKDALRSQQRMMVDTSYGQLLKCLTAQPETIQAFKDLLLDRQVAMMDLGMGVISAGSKEEREAQAQKIQAIQKDFDAQVQALLGTDDYTMYKQYEETQPERMQVNLFNQSLGTDSTLTEAQQHELIRAMYEERTAFKFSVASGPGQDPSALLDPAAAARHLEEMETLQTRYAERAQTILSPAQMESFRKSQDQQRQMQKMGIQMAIQMMGTTDSSGEK